MSSDLHTHSVLFLYLLTGMCTHSYKYHKHTDDDVCVCVIVFKTRRTER